MKGVRLLAWHHARHHRLRTAILVACVAVPLFVPAAARVLVHRYEHELGARAAAVPLVGGAEGERFDLTLGALFFTARDLPPLSAGALDELRAEGRGTAIPLHFACTAQGRPLVGTAPEYFELRGLRPARGTLPLLLGDVVLGADAARALGLDVGDTLFSDQRDVYDISVPPAIELAVTGVLAPSGGPDDRVVLADVKTCWLVEGHLHGHADVAEVDPDLVIARTETGVTVSPALIEERAFEPGAARDFHAHGDPARLPLSGVLYVPDDEKAATLARSRWNADPTRQMVAPAAVLEELFAYVLRVRALLDALALVLLVSTALLVALVLWLSARIRAAEMRTLHDLGAPRGTVARLHAAEIGLVLLASLGVAALGLLATSLWGPGLERLL